jgi:hypothetical protein
MGRRWLVLGTLVLLLFTGCQTAPRAQYALGTLLYQDDFSQPYHWDAFQQDNIQIGVKDGAYEIRSDVRNFVRGFNDQMDNNVVIEVNARQFSTENNNAFGVICRGSLGDAAAGYYFLIGGDGTYSIRRGRGDQIEALVAWSRTGAVHTGTDKNVIRVVCVDNYLALYVNGDLVADAYDSSFQKGFTGFAAAVTQGGTIDVTFDNLKIWSATLQSHAGS